MKWLLTALLVSNLFTSYAQTNQTKLTKSLPAVITCKANEISGAFIKAAGEKISFSFPDNFVAHGVVKSSIVKYANLQTTIIELPDFGKSLFQLSKRTNEDKTVTYVGRIINTTEGYLYELKNTANGEYQLTKQELNKVRPTCDLLK
jgi:hypothetical protein